MTDRKARVPRRPRRPRTSVPATSAPLTVTDGPPSDAAPVVVLNSAPTYAAFGWLLLTGVLCAFLRGPLLVVAVLVGAFIIWVKLCMRYPRTMFVITAFLRGLLSRR